MFQRVNYFCTSMCSLQYLILYPRVIKTNNCLYWKPDPMQERLRERVMYGTVESPIRTNARLRTINSVGSNTSKKWWHERKSCYVDLYSIIFLYIKCLFLHIKSVNTLHARILFPNFINYVFTLNDLWTLYLLLDFYYKFAHNISKLVCCFRQTVISDIRL